MTKPKLTAIEIELVGEVYRRFDGQWFWRQVLIDSSSWVNCRPPRPVLNLTAKIGKAVKGKVKK